LCSYCDAIRSKLMHAAVLRVILTPKEWLKEVSRVRPHSCGGKALGLFFYSLLKCLKRFIVLLPPLAFHGSEKFFSKTETEARISLR
jgi:hypothetical protein